MSYRRLLMDLVLTGANRIRDITRVTAPAASTPGHVVRVASDGESLELAAPGGAGLDLTGRAKGDLLVVNHDGEGNPVASWLPIGTAGQVLYVTPALMPAWGTPSGGVTGVRLLSPDGSPLLSPDSSPLVTTS